jgi:hypothetical protein
VSDVVDGTGKRWVVRRRWALRLGAETLFGRFRRRVRGTGRRAGRLTDGLDVGDGCIDIEAVLIVIVVIAVVLVAVFFVIPLLVALIDLLVLLLLTVVGVLARVVFRRPWTVEARGEDGVLYHWKVVGWRASGERRDEIAEMLAAGIIPPDATLADT